MREEYSTQSISLHSRELTQKQMSQEFALLVNSVLLCSCFSFSFFFFLSVFFLVSSFGGHSVLPNIVSHMKRPQANYRSMTIWSYAIIGVIYTATAAGGYAGWVRNNTQKRTDEETAHDMEIGFASLFFHPSIPFCVFCALFRVLM